MEKKKGGGEAATPTRVLRDEEALTAALLKPRPLESRLEIDDGQADEGAKPYRDPSRTASRDAEPSGRLLSPLSQEHQGRNVAQAFRLVVSGGSGEAPDAVRTFRLEGHTTPEGTARE
ncbi:MAG: hypothetical protein QNJ67_12515 [Kiloniellales bacterium]|nr:hypothetical protein [Kiloniellales bacterium]